MIDGFRLRVREGVRLIGEAVSGIAGDSEVVVGGSQLDCGGW